MPCCSHTRGSKTNQTTLELVKMDSHNEMMTKSLDTPSASTHCSLDKEAANNIALNASVTRTFLFSRTHTALSVYFADATSE